MAWLRLLNPAVGSLNVFLRDLFHLSASPFNIYSLGGLTFVLTTFYYPYAFITISRAMEKMDPSLEEASRISGASPLKTVFTVTLPVMLPSIVSGALLVFVSAASCYGIPSIIGKPRQVHTITTRIVEYVSIGNAEGLTDATCLAVFLMLLAILVLYLSNAVLGGKQYVTVSGKSTRPNIVDLRRWRIPVTAMMFIFAGIIIALPFWTVISTSVTQNLGKDLTAPGNFTLKHWETIFGRPAVLTSMGNSVLFGAIAATAGMVIACVMSYLNIRTRTRGRSIPAFLITLGSSSPSIVIALGLIMTMSGRFRINIYNTAYIMIVAYLIKYQLMGMRTVTSAMTQLHVSLEECSQISGASWLKTMKNITLPLIAPSLAAGWFLIFIPSFYELSMSTILYSSATQVIGVQLHEYWTYTSQQQACAMATAILGSVVFINVILNRLTKGEFSI
jgi:iron(III) transport system permease protein